jgi:hypothetical protein
LAKSLGYVALRYIILLTLVTAAFGQFLACGSQMYRVSLENDVAQTESTAAKGPDDPQFGLHSPNGWAQLPISIVFEDGLSSRQIEAIKRAMLTWERATGRDGEIFQFSGIHKGVTGDSFPNLISSLSDQLNGHYFDVRWQKTGKAQHVLATAIWDTVAHNRSTIQTGDIRYNSEVYLFGDALVEKANHEKQIVDLESLALHEVGHFLGLDHIDGKFDRFSVMNPVVFIGEGFASRQLSHGDISRIQRIYGCQGLACDIDAYLDQEAWDNRQRMVNNQ